jgi:hypothetical protein
LHGKVDADAAVIREDGGVELKGFETGRFPSFLFLDHPLEVRTCREVFAGEDSGVRFWSGWCGDLQVRGLLG